jgi:hypothetical protein
VKAKAVRWFTPGRRALVAALVFVAVLALPRPSAAQAPGYCYVADSGCYWSGCGSNYFTLLSGEWAYASVYCWSGTNWQLSQYVTGCCWNA